jgi:RNA polymerase sigma-70 factor (ECF subfamily)
MPENGTRPLLGRRVLAAIHTGRTSFARLIARTFNRQEVDDVLTDAFIRSRDSGGGKPTLRSQSAFLLRTATAIAMNRFSRSDPRPNAHAEDLTVPEVQQLSSDSHEAENDASQRFVAFCRAVGGLPEECRRVMILKKVYGLSLGEIADHLGTTRAVVEKDLSRGLMMCRDYLESASRPGSGGGDPPDVRRTGQTK